VACYDGKASWVQVSKALDAAHGEARRLNGGNPVSDDTIWITPGDDSINVWFEQTHTCAKEEQ
jgi:hypothetical protein